MGVLSLFVPEILKYTALLHSNSRTSSHFSPLIISAGVFFPSPVGFCIFHHTHSLFQTRDGFEAFQQPLKVQAFL